MLLSSVIMADDNSGQDAILTFNLDSCRSYRFDNTHIDYSEFTAEITNSNDVSLSVVNNTLYRVNPQQNRHSCTPGLNGTEAMCISYDQSCNYQAGNERSLRFDILVTPTGNNPAQLRELNFHEMAPTMFDWIDGPSGLNNYPTQYGVRVLKNNAVIYEQSGLATTTEWSLESFDFSSNSDFTVEAPTVFQFELLAYCPIGNFAMQNVWDVEDITVIATCESSCPATIDGASVSLINGGTTYNGCVGDINVEVTNNSAGDPNNYYYIITDNNDNILAFVNSTVTNMLDLSGAPAGECHIWGWSQIGFSDPIPGQHISSLADEACEEISDNFITVDRAEPQGGTLTGGPFEFCVGDGTADNIAANGITLAGNSGTNSQWVVTDDLGNILGLPPTFSAVNFDGAPPGTCLVWHLSFEDGLTGAAMGLNANDLQGCFSLSNPITVNRISAEAATLTGGPFSFCVSDGTADNIPTGAITVTGGSGTNTQWIVTDNLGNILGLPPTPEAVDFDGAGVGTCLVWYLTYNGTISGLEMGQNAANIQGCHGLSNPITVQRNEAIGGTLSGGPFEFCVGDGVADNIAAGAISLTGNSGPNSQWIVTDDQGLILGLPPMPSVVDFDGAGTGTCLIWHLSYSGVITGLAAGQNANDLTGCLSLSNSIAVNRIDCTISGGTLTGGPFEFCVDGTPDMVSGITLTGTTGTNNSWIVTDPQGNILGLPPMPGVVDFDAAGPGVCLIWNISYENGLTGLAMGNNVSGLVGNFGLSNSITVTRNEAVGGTLTGGPFEFIVDGTPDMVSGITLNGNSGTNTAWVITDDQGNILGLPPMPGVVDFDAAGVGVCYIYSISYENGLNGLAMGNNLSTLSGCFDLSNFITVTRVAPNAVSGGTLAGGPFEFCVDGTPDMVSGITLTGTTGTNNSWIVTDPQGNILGLPPMPGVVDFDAAGPGVCLIWNISYENGLTGLAMGNNVSGLVGNFGLSNSITVTRNEAVGGTLTGGPFEFDSVGDGVADMIPAGSITLSGNAGQNSQWLVTDSQGNILGLPPMPSAVDFDGAGSGICLIWHLSYEDGLTGLSMGSNASDLQGCFSLSNSIEVIRNNASGCNTNGGALFGGPFNFTVGDGIMDTIALDSFVLANNSGMNSQWVVTDSNGYILGLPPTINAVNFDGAGFGVCLVWHLAYEDGLTGLEMGLNANDLQGCFSLSNAMTVNRTNANGCNQNGGALFGGPFEFCVGDGIQDTIAAGAITLANSGGTNSQWIVTDEAGEILGLPAEFSDVDFEGAPVGTCLVWHLSYETGVIGLEVGMNASNLMGCFSLSNSISVIRKDCTMPIGVIVINEINSNNEIEIKNNGTQSIDISSYWLCNFPAYDQLSTLTIQCGGDLILDPGELVTVISNFNIDENDGELALYTINSFSDVSAIFDYVEWGSSGHQRSSLAASAGIWTAGDFVASFSAGNSIEYDGQGNSSSDWAEDTASPCQENSIGSNPTSLNYSIYPNPSTNAIQLEFKERIEGTITAMVIDRMGRVVSTTEMSSEGKLSIEDLESGSYYIKVIKDRMVEIKPFIKI